MPLLKRRTLRPRVVRFLHRQLESPDVDEPTKEKIAKVLDDPKLTEKVNGGIFNLLKKENRLEVADVGELAVGAVGGPFLDGLMEFLKQNWSQILAMILKLFGL